jgi:hypothetical protein
MSLDRALGNLLEKMESSFRTPCRAKYREGKKKNRGPFADLPISVLIRSQIA